MMTTSTKFYAINAFLDINSTITAATIAQMDSTSASQPNNALPAQFSTANTATQTPTVAINASLDTGSTQLQTPAAISLFFYKPLF